MCSEEDSLIGWLKILMNSLEMVPLFSAVVRVLCCGAAVDLWGRVGSAALQVCLKEKLFQFVKKGSLEFCPGEIWRTSAGSEGRFNLHKAGLWCLCAADERRPQRRSYISRSTGGCCLVCKVFMKLYSAGRRAAGSRRRSRGEIKTKSRRRKRNERGRRGMQAKNVRETLERPERWKERRAGWWKPTNLQD